MLAYHVPDVLPAQALDDARTSRLSIMGKWHALSDGGTGTILHQPGWTKQHVGAARLTPEGWMYLPGDPLPALSSLQRPDMPAAETIRCQDGTVLWVPLAQLSPRRAIFSPGNYRYGEHTQSWALHAFALFAEFTDTKEGGLSIFSTEEKVMRVIYTALCQTYRFTHELATDLLAMTPKDMIDFLYVLWGYDPKASRSVGGISPSLPPASPPASG